MESNSEVPRPLRILAWPKRIGLNPYFAIISEGLEQQGCRVVDFRYRHALVGRFDVLHVHFPTFPFNNRHRWIALVRMAILMSLLTLLRARGRRVAWTIHNLAHHERFHVGLERRFMDWFTGKVDLAIHLSESGRLAALDRFPRLGRRRSVVIPHPRYAEPGPGLAPRKAAPSLGVPPDAPMLLFFGQIRPYKNIPDLISAFSTLPMPAGRLVIAGLASDVLAREMQALSIDPRIQLNLRQIPEEELQVLLAATTLVVLPYREILNSGAALLSLTHRRPVLVPDRGAMAELQSCVGPEWVRLFQPPLTSAHLAEAVDWARSRPAGAPDLSAFSPDLIVRAHARAFAELAPGHRRLAPDARLAPKLGAALQAPPRRPR
jgi:beta-1,4-mannosyltransferase